MTRARLRDVLKWSGFLGAALLLILWAAGAFRHERVEPGRAGEEAGLPAPAATARAVRARVPVFEDTVGTVQSRRRVVVSAQMSGRVLAVEADVGERVTAGAPLVRLEDTEASARYAEAKAHFERVRGFFARRAATRAELESAESAYVQAKAALEHARIAAPIDGVVSERSVEPGDLAWPRRQLMVVLDPERLRLEAEVREGLIGDVKPGASLDVALPATGRTVEGTVAEVLPSADPRSRTFSVRVTLDTAPGVYPGMFGRLRLPVGEREVVRAPAEAVHQVGQLETVVVQEDGHWRRRAVTTGTTFDDGTVEVLSGLDGGETVGLPAPERPS